MYSLLLNLFSWIKKCVARCCKIAQYHTSVINSYIAVLFNCLDFWCRLISIKLCSLLPGKRIMWLLFECMTAAILEMLALYLLSVNHCYKVNSGLTVFPSVFWLSGSVDMKDIRPVKLRAKDSLSEKVEEENWGGTD